MIDINSISIAGRIVYPPEVKHTANGNPYFKTSIASNYNTRQGDQYIQSSNFFEIIYYGKNSESLSKIIDRGTQVMISGEIRQDRWKDKESGKDKEKFYIICKDLQIFFKESKGSSEIKSTKDFIEKAERNIPKMDSDFVDDIPF